jgi:hypothetical protein
MFVALIAGAAAGVIDTALGATTARCPLATVKSGSLNKSQKRHVGVSRCAVCFFQVRDSHSTFTAVARELGCRRFRLPCADWSTCRHEET